MLNRYSNEVDFVAEASNEIVVSCSQPDTTDTIIVDMVRVTLLFYVSPFYSTCHPSILRVTLLFYVSPFYSTCHPCIIRVTLVFYVSPLYYTCHPSILRVTLVFYVSPLYSTCHPCILPSLIESNCVHKCCYLQVFLMNIATLTLHNVNIPDRQTWSRTLIKTMLPCSESNKHCLICTRQVTRARHHI